MIIALVALFEMRQCNYLSGKGNGSYSLSLLKLFLMMLSLFPQVDYCFRKISAEILGVKLSKAEVEQTSVSFFKSKYCKYHQCLKLAFRDLHEFAVGSFH